MLDSVMGQLVFDGAARKRQKQGKRRKDLKGGRRRCWRGEEGRLCSLVCEICSRMQKLKKERGPKGSEDVLLGM